MPLALAAGLLVGWILPTGPSAEGRRERQTPPARTWDERRLVLPIVGASTAYVPRARTARVVLFISGDGGWNAGVVDMARRIASQAVVVGISFPKLAAAAVRQGGCWYPAGDLETIAHAAEKRLGLDEYSAPLLIGYSSGATLVYAALAPAPPATFAGGLSLGFCADLDVAKPVCRATGWAPEYDARKHLSWLPRRPALPKPWYVLHGIQDQVCSPADARAFTSAMANAHFVEVPGTGHGFGRPVRWGPAFDAALDAIWKPSEPARRVQPQAPSFAAIEERLDRLGLPLEYRWPKQEPTATLIFFSGDGGWAALDDGVASALTDRGIAVVGVSSIRYFWRSKTPAEVSATLRALIGALGRPIFVGGYSFGAEVVPVTLRDWTPAERSAISGLVLVAPGPSASFEIEPLDWLRTPPEDPATRVAPAVRTIGLPAVCIAGQDEEDSGCRQLPNAPPFHVEVLPGSHHFDGNYATIAERIAAFVQSVTGRSASEASDQRRVNRMFGF